MTYHTTDCNALIATTKYANSNCCSLTAHAITDWPCEQLWLAASAKSGWAEVYGRWTASFRLLFTECCEEGYGAALGVNVGLEAGNWGLIDAPPGISTGPACIDKFVQNCNSHKPINLNSRSHLQFKICKLSFFNLLVLYSIFSLLTEIP